MSRKTYAFLRGDHHLVEQKLHDRYGHVIRTGPDSLAFSSLSAFDAIYGFNRSIEKGDFYNFARDARTQAENIFSSRTDATHREHRRKVVGPAFSGSKVATYEPIISKNTAILVSRLTDARASSEDASTVNVAPQIHQYTFDTMIEVVYGEPICPQPYTDTKAGRSVLKGFRDISKLAWGAALLPWFGWVMSTRPMVYLARRPTYDSEGNLTSVAALAGSTRDLTFAHAERALESTQASIMKSYLQVQDTDPKRMLPVEIWPECFNMTFAGPGSTAAGLTAILHELGRPHGQPWQGRIRADLRDADAAASPTSSPVLVAVIKETLRLHAPFPTAFPREIRPGAESAIPDLPAPLPVGTLVSANTYILGRSTAIWGADASAWKPERWLEPEAEGNRPDDKFVVFSKGARGCVGREVAILVLARAVAAVLARWELGARGELRGKNFLEMQFDECRIALSELR